MANEKHRVFISYHHANDQAYKDSLAKFSEENDIFIDASVDIDEIDDDLDDEAIREKIRDEYLRDSSVTILLVGTGTKGRKHVDWELYSSMYNGKINKQSGILVITLPTTKCINYFAAHGQVEKSTIYPENKLWTGIDERAEFERRYPEMPDRIIDNLLSGGAKISVTNWEKLTPDKLRFLIDVTYSDRTNAEYDLSRPMRRANS